MIKTLSVLVCTALLLGSCGKSEVRPGTQAVSFDYTKSFPKSGFSMGMKFDHTPRPKLNAPFVLRFWKTDTGNATTGPLS